MVAVAAPELVAADELPAIDGELVPAPYAGTIRAFLEMDPAEFADIPDEVALDWQREVAERRRAPAGRRHGW